MKLPYFKIYKAVHPCGCIRADWELEWYKIYKKGTYLEKAENCKYSHHCENKYPPKICPRIEEINYSDGIHEIKILYNKNNNEVIQLTYSWGELTGGRIGGIPVKAELAKDAWKRLVKIFERAVEPDFLDILVGKKTANFKIEE